MWCTRSSPSLCPAWIPLLVKMSLWVKFTEAIYKETVLVWALGMYGTGIAVAAIVPSFHDKRKQDNGKPENPPTLKEVIAGLQKRLGH